MKKPTNSKKKKDMYSHKAQKGEVGIQARNGRLQLNLPRPWFDGVQKRFLLGLPDTDENRKLAAKKAREIELDYLSGNFDPTLDKYRDKERGKANLTVLQNLTKHESLSDLWTQYYEYKRVSLKETTQIHYESLGRHIEAVGNIDSLDAIEVRKRLQERTTNHQVKRCLIEINAAIKWAIKHRLITGVSVSPYEGMVSELPKYNYQDNPKPNAFSFEEMETVIEAFRNHKGNWNGKGFTGFKYSYYAPFVEFLFLTGCRTSEAVGLKWRNINSDCSEIFFNGSLLYKGNKWIETKGSKNNKSRTFPCSNRLTNLLQSIKPENVDPESLVFPAVKGGAINRDNFSKTAWTKIVDPIKPDTTPYSCRDTFITHQLMKNVQATIIAKWTDTSVHLIETVYMDVIKLLNIRPQD